MQSVRPRSGSITRLSIALAMGLSAGCVGLAIAGGGFIPARFCTYCHQDPGSGSQVCATVVCFGSGGCTGQVCPGNSQVVRACCGTACPDDGWLDSCSAAP